MFGSGPQITSPHLIRRFSPFHSCTQARARRHDEHLIGRMCSHKGHHHFIDKNLVAEVEGNKVRLSAIGAVAVTMEEEK